MAFVLAILGVLIVTLIVVQLCGEYVYRYRLTDDSIEFLIVTWRAGRLAYRDIASIETTSLGRALTYVPAVFLGRPLGRYVLVHRRDRPPLLITPSRPEDFIERVQEKLGGSTERS